MRNSMKTWNAVLLAVVVGIFFQNCGKFAPIDLGLDDNNLLSSLSNNCFESEGESGCIFYKNPMIQGSRELTPEQMDQVPLESLLGYKIENADESRDQITGTGVKIITSTENAPAEETKSEALRKKIAHNMAWYWSGKVADFISQSGGQNLMQSELKIIPHAPETGLSSASKTILLRYPPSGLPDAFDASILVHLMGEAFVREGSGSTLKSGLAEQHNSCGQSGEALYANNCCKNEKGCALAIVAGLSDYLVTRIFPELPAVGEAIARDSNGIKICQLHRNPLTVQLMSAPAAYGACEKQGQKGEVYSMGAYYASLWYAVNQKASEVSPEREQQLQRLYVKSLSLVSGNDTFESFHQKLKQIDDAEFQGSLMPLFNQEIALRSQ